MHQDPRAVTRRTLRRCLLGPCLSLSFSLSFAFSFALVLAFTVAYAVPANADLDSYLTLEIDSTPVPGGVTLAGREGTIRVVALDLSGFSVVTQTGGVATPKSRPVTFLMDADRSLPVILGTWAAGRAVTEAVFRLYEPTGGGAEFNFLTLTLTGGRVSSVALSSPDSLDPDLQARPATALVGFTYATAELTHTLTGNTQTISWQSGP